MYSNSNITSKPGFNQQKLETLESIAKNEQVKGKKLYLTMSFDEMAIIRHIQWIHQQKIFSGLIQYGKRDTDDVYLSQTIQFFPSF